MNLNVSAVVKNADAVWAATSKTERISYQRHYSSKWYTPFSRYSVAVCVERT